MQVAEYKWKSLTESEFSHWLLRCDQEGRSSGGDDPSMYEITTSPPTPHCSQCALGCLRAAKRTAEQV